jgi:alpha-ketoglutarate-dependent taurine dioxygenase
MKEETPTHWTLDRLSPFGLIVNSRSEGANLHDIPIETLKEWVDQHRVVVLRRFAPLTGKLLPEFCQKLGELLDWDFGVVNELRVHADSKNYLYTNHAVPFHWDGAFVGRIPHYIFFHCDVAPPVHSGGETLFCDTLRLLDQAPLEEQEKWARITITYSTQKVVHYGGSFTSSMIVRHPTSGEKILRFAEPVEDLNPVRLEIKGIATGQRDLFLQDLRRRLYSANVCLTHQWLTGDILLADNQRLLHGRRAFAATAWRQIRRVNIM